MAMAAGPDLSSIVERNRTEILDLVRRHRGRSIAVFGSVARGEATSGSDIDFLVEFEPSSSLLDLVHLEEAWPNCSVSTLTSCQRGRCSNATPRSATTRSSCESGRRSSSRRLGDGGRRDRCDRRSTSLCVRRRHASPGTIERCRSTPRPSELADPCQAVSSAHRS